MDIVSPFYERNKAWAKPQDSYLTALSPQEQGQFDTWLKANAGTAPGIRNWQNSPTSDYDMPGYWKALQAGTTQGMATDPTDGLPHFPDTFKTPYHESFSNESQYALPNAPSWQGEGAAAKLVDKDGNLIFDPTNTAQMEFQRAWAGQQQADPMSGTSMGYTGGEPDAQILGWTPDGKMKFGPAGVARGAYLDRDFGNSSGGDAGGEGD